MKYISAKVITFCYFKLFDSLCLSKIFLSNKDSPSDSSVDFKLNQSWSQSNKDMACIKYSLKYIICYLLIFKLINNIKDVERNLSTFRKSYYWVCWYYGWSTLNIKCDNNKNVISLRKERVLSVCHELKNQYLSTWIFSCSLLHQLRSKRWLILPCSNISLTSAQLFYNCKTKIGKMGRLAMIRKINHQYFTMLD